MMRANPVPWPLRDRWQSAGNFHARAKWLPQALCLLAAAMLCWLAAPSAAAQVPSGSPAQSKEKQPRNTTGQASLDYSATYSASGCAFGLCTDRSYTQQFSGSVTLKRTEEDDEYEGFHGQGTASYSHTRTLDVKPSDGCPAGKSEHTVVTGTVTLTVNAACALNGMTAGPDTSMYDYYTTNVEGLIEAYDLHLESKWHDCNGHRDSLSHDEAAAGTGCFFYNVDFDNGGTYKYAGEEADETPFVCTMAITLPPGPKLRVYGTVKGLGGNRPDRQGPFPISNARVVAMEFEQPRLKKLSELQPAFTRKTLTSDDEEAKYELELSFCERPHKIVVVSVLWYEGEPIFAVVNGPQPTAGTRGIPIYLAACVDDDPHSKCYKWKEVDDGYEAEVNFEYGNDDQIDRQDLFMDEEDWQGISTRRELLQDSAYIYFNSYRSVKYFEDKGIAYPKKPLLIASHHRGPEEKLCNGGQGDNAYYYDGQFAYGGLGKHLEVVQGTGGGIFICSKTSPLDFIDAPLNREWHEFGHYLHTQDFDPRIRCQKCGFHKGYLINLNTSWAQIEGFATFVAALTNKHYGDPEPSWYRVGTAPYDLEIGFKAWGWNGLDEELAIAGMLWDLYDPGKELALKHRMNGRWLQVSKVYPDVMDVVSLPEQWVIQQVLDGRSSTVWDLYNFLVVSGKMAPEELDMILLDHGFFGDVEERNYIHDSTNEEIGYSGSTEGPNRPSRLRPVPSLPGSFLVSDSGGSFEVTVTLLQDNAVPYSYTLDLEPGVPAYFTMPPEYYPSRAELRPLVDGKKGPVALEIDSDEYWDYIRSGPEASAVFRRLPP